MGNASKGVRPKYPENLIHFCRPVLEHYELHVEMGRMFVRSMVHNSTLVSHAAQCPPLPPTATLRLALDLAPYQVVYFPALFGYATQRPPWHSQIIRNARIQNICKYQSCMVSHQARAWLTVICVRHQEHARCDL